MGYKTGQTLKLRCVHCGRIDWGKTPKLEVTMRWIVKRGRSVTSNNVARGLGISLDLAHRRMQALVDAGLVTWEWEITRNGPRTGGRRRRYRATIGPIDFERPPSLR